MKFSPRPCFGDRLCVYVEVAITRIAFSGFPTDLEERYPAWCGHGLSPWSLLGWPGFEQTCTSLELPRSAGQPVVEISGLFSVFD